jgi:hypothetical protein
MENDVANAMIAAALIQSGQFKLSDFNERGKPFTGDADHRTPAERLMRQAHVLGDPEFDAFASPALTSLRKLTNAIRRALYELPSEPPQRAHR